MPLELTGRPTISAERLRLEDGGLWILAPDLALLDEDYLRFGRFPASWGADEIKDHRSDSDQAGKAVHWAIVERADGEIVGLMELFIANADDRWLEAGYWIRARTRGQGLATEADRAAGVGGHGT